MWLQAKIKHVEGRKRKNIATTLRTLLSSMFIVDCRVKYIAQTKHFSSINYTILHWSLQGIFLSLTLMHTEVSYRAAVLRLAGFQCSAQGHDSRIRFLSTHWAKVFRLKDDLVGDWLKKCVLDNLILLKNGFFSSSPEKSYSSRKELIY